MAASETISLAPLAALGMAAAAGFLVGFEREWSKRAEGEPHVFAGARTFTIVAVVGALTGIIGGAGFAIAAFIVIGALTTVSYYADARRPDGGRGGTTEIALLATYLLGLAASKDMMLVAAIGAVGLAVILSLKDEITHIAGAMDEKEIHATMRFLIVSVMILPLLPNEGFGPYDALNPRDIWKMVVFISGLSFVGYWLTKWLGAGKGVLITGLVGGLASSTATTLSLARRAKEAGGDETSYAAGIVIANVVMIIRIGILFSVLAPSALATIAPALAAGGLVGAAAALLFWRAARSKQQANALELGNPFEIRPALVFAAILALISLAAAFGADKFGAAGLFIVALISGLADVDAITIAAAKDASAGAIAASLAANAALIAAASNIFVKGAMSFTAGGQALGLRVATAFAAILIAAGAARMLF